MYLIAESRAIVPSGHECDKKKFYDPQDIRKYMMKKKNERREKEKEEKCKKAKEQAALKRKAEVTKLFSNRAKFLSHRNDDQQVSFKLFVFIANIFKYFSLISPLEIFVYVLYAYFLKTLLTGLIINVINNYKRVA